jgi:hypothetical protein
MFASLADKIGLKRLDRFAFVLQATQTLNDYIVQANERVSQVNFRNCRVVFSDFWNIITVNIKQKLLELMETLIILYITISN